MESNNRLVKIEQAFAADEGIILKRKAKLKERLEETEHVFALKKEDMSKHFEQCETELREQLATVIKDQKSS